MSIGRFAAVPAAVGNREVAEEMTRLERALKQTASQPAAQRFTDIQLGLRLTYITLGWMTIEGAASLLLGWASKSLLLEAFGIDSVIELFSAFILLWRLCVEASGVVSAERAEEVGRRAARYVGHLLFMLVL